MERVICKTCGATLSLQSGATEIECEYCATRQKISTAERIQGKVNPLDQQIKDHQQLSAFGDLCKKSMREREEKQGRISKLRGELSHKCTDNQEAVRKKYRAMAEFEANADEKILTRRFVACLVVAALFVAIILINASLLLWGGIGAAVVLLFFFRPGYARNWRIRYEEKVYQKLTESAEYRTDMRNAAAEDEKQTKLNYERAKAEIRRLEDRTNGLGWLYEELQKTVMEIRREATLKGFSNFMDQTDASIVDVLVNKMNAAIFYRDIPLSYHEAIRKGKEKAIADWIGCARSLSNIEDMLGQLFK